MADYMIRRATLADCDQLVRLRRLMFDEMNVRSDVGSPWEDAFAAQLANGHETGVTAAFLAEVDGRVVGGGVGTILEWPPGPWTPDGRSGHVYSMATDPDWRGRGIARAVVAALLDWFVGEGVHRVALHATEAGEPIYRSFGFADGPYPELIWWAGPTHLE